VEHRTAYLSALARASIDANIGPFSTFLAERASWSLEKGTINGSKTSRKPARTLKKGLARKSRNP
jgi:hypothetical protein